MSNIQGKKILLVEDDEVLSRMYEKRLMLEHADVMLAKNGREALEKLSEGEVDLMLLDLMMPDMNGYEVIKKVRENPEQSKIPIIVLTNLDAHPEYIEKATGSKVEEYLIKSDVSVNEVVEKISEHLPQ